MTSLSLLPPSSEQWRRFALSVPMQMIPLYPHFLCLHVDLHYVLVAILHLQ
jgi:hypothetical protein